MQDCQCFQLRQANCRGENALWKAGVAQVVANPSTSIASLTARGRPHRGRILCPLSYLSSTAWAEARACEMLLSNRQVLLHPEHAAAS